MNITLSLYEIYTSVFTVWILKIHECISYMAIAICKYNYVDLEFEDQILQVK